MRTFTRMMINPFDPEDDLDHLIAQVTKTLDASGAGILLEGRNGELAHVSSSGAMVADVERVQEREHTGACYEAYETNQVITVDDLQAEQRWPAYTRRALDVGLRSVCGVPLNARGRTIGVLNVYRSEPSQWTRDEIDACEILGALGAAYILSAKQLLAQGDLAQQLQTALDSRVVIEQAKGILMARTSIDATTAFELLRESSRDGNRKLRDTAQDIVDSEQTDPPSRV